MMFGLKAAVTAFSVRAFVLLFHVLVNVVAPHVPGVFVTMGVLESVPVKPGRVRMIVSFTSMPIVRLKIDIGARF